MATRDEILAEIAEIKNQYKPSEQNNTRSDNVGESSTTGNVTRAVAQGLTFGFADEIEAVFKSIGKDKTYKEAVDEVRAKVDKFRKDNPVLAYGAEIAGSVPTMLLGGAGVRAVQGAGKLAKGATTGSKVGSAMKTGAVSGGIYGAGAGEGAEGKAIGAVVGGALGGALGGLTAKILPKTTAKAKELMKKDIRLTQGQAFGGEGNVMGGVIQNLEQSTSSLVGVGSPIQTAKLTSLVDFNRAVIKEALEPAIGKMSNKQFNSLIPKNLKGNELFQYADDIMKNSYNKELANVSLNSGAVNSLKNTITQSIRTSNTSTANKNKVLAEIGNLIKSKTEKGGGMSGVAFKELERDLSALSASYKRSQGGDIFLARLIDNAKKDAGNILKAFNPESNLANINKSQVGMSAIQKAVNKANGTQGIFSTKQFLNALKQNDMSIGKKSTARGEGFLKETAQLADDVMGGAIPDSGTASRLITGNISVDPVKALAYAPATIASEIAYGIGRPAVRGLLQVPRVGMNTITPTASGLLGGASGDALKNRGILR